jgi:DNA invertase Pin-like site-specific DNA recombinase
MPIPSSRQLRFAGLVRVSTDPQAKRGESLRTQRKNNTKDVELLHGVIVERYGEGKSEHATEGEDRWEREELKRLIADARQGKFTAVIIAHADRWDRGSKEAKEALEVFRERGIRFFISTTEYNLKNPEHVLFLDLSASVNKFFASNQKKKSLLNKIERAKRGWPSCGQSPFGRVFNRSTETWGLDSVKHAAIVDIVHRFLDGGSLLKLCSEYRHIKGIRNHANLCKLLRNRLGDTWEQNFDADDLDIHEVVPVKVPALCDPDTIQRVQLRLDTQKTYHRGSSRLVNRYLLSGFVYCAHCGYAYTGTPHPRGVRLYYRHNVKHGPIARARECPIGRPEPLIRADVLESTVIAKLFAMYGNPAQIERAIRTAVPQAEPLRKRQTQLQADLEKVERTKKRTMNLVDDDTITEADIKDKMGKLKEQEADIKTQLASLDEQLVNMPTEESIRCYVEKVKDSIFVYDDHGDFRNGGNDVATMITMSEADKRKMLEAVFAIPQPNGKPSGIYIWPTGRNGRQQKFAFAIRGHLPFEMVVPEAVVSTGDEPLSESARAELAAALEGVKLEVGCMPRRLS